MKCIVPLAGPDLWTDEYGFRPCIDLNGTPLIEAALDRRAWRDRLSGADYIFVIREVANLDDLREYLQRRWPGCQIVTLSNLTGGALFSALAGMALVAPDEPVIIDLADILFSDGPDDPEALFSRQGYGAIVPVFSSTESCYSYLEIVEGLVTRAREKVVISDNASAGVYMFRNIQVFLRAAVHNIDERASMSHRGVLFICPMVNGIIADGHAVAAPHIGDCRPVGKIFHQK
jgi:dTDP-glucose pyrophosphorylase